VTDCRKANQGKKSHKNVESFLFHYFNIYTHITATKAKPFPNCMQADILLSGITTIDNPTSKDCDCQAALSSRIVKPHRQAASSSLVVETRDC
jgi:hypothetical protein